MPDQTEKYVVIASYEGQNDSEGAISSIDGASGYLHMHVIKKDELEKLPAITMDKIGELSEANTTYQWGLPLYKDLKTRSSTVTLRDILKYGNLGLGSAAMGQGEEIGKFSGGGEVLIIPDESGVKAFRITKNQGLFPLNLDESCWIAEVTNHNKNDKIIRSITNDQHLENRAELLKFLQSIHGQKDKPFIAKFEARFDKEHFAVRSNGLFPQDEVGEERHISLFNALEGKDPVGGHLLGDSASEGDRPEKHNGVAPADVKVSLTITPGTLEIIPSEKKLIALRNDPNNFHTPLSQEDLMKELEPTAENHKPIVINGGGIAGVVTALKLAKQGIPSTILEQKENLLSSTSGSTPGRVGHGFHYRDLETAKLYLQSSITFLKEYCTDPDLKKRFIVSLQDSISDVDRGIYFISKDSQVSSSELLPIYEGIREEYRNLSILDPSNKIFGEANNFFEELDLKEFSELAATDKMAAAIRTQEKLLNWPEFNAYLQSAISHYQKQGLISVLTNKEVTKIEYDEGSIDQKFLIKMHNQAEEKEEQIAASYFVNASWSSIEALDSTLFPEAALEERTNRMKLIAHIELPEDKHNTPSMFTAMGPYSMFSNEGNGKGKTTFAPVTNVLDYVIEEFKKEPVNESLQTLWNGWKTNGEIPEEINHDDSLRNIERQLKVPKLFERWLAEGLNQKEKDFFGTRILSGTIESYPALRGSKLTNVGAGIVKSNGEVNIRDKESAFHQRSDHGIKERQIGYIDFNGVKLFYGESQSRKVVEQIIDDIKSNVEIKKLLKHNRKTEIATEAKKEATEEVKKQASANYTRRFAKRADSKTWRTILEERAKPTVNVVNEEYTSYMKDAVESLLNLYLKESKSTINFLSPPTRQFISRLGSNIKDIVDNNDNDFSFLEEKQQDVISMLPELFTVFSVINTNGDIIADGKYGRIDSEEMRKEHNIPSLKDRDYVQEMINNSETKVFCGKPVIGSTSGIYMIPAGIRLGNDNYITFGVPVEGLSRIITPLQQRSAV